MAISEQDLNNPRAFIMQRGKVLRAPGRDVSEFELPPLTQVPYEERQAMIEGEAKRAARQYQDEVDSADRVRRRQEMEDYFQHGLRPPAFTSEFAPQTAAEISASRPRFMNVSGDLYDVTSGTPKLAVDTPDKLDRRIWDIAGTSGIPLGEGMQWVYGPSGYVQEPIPKVSELEMIDRLQKRRGGTNALTAPAISPRAAGEIRSFNSEAEARQAGVKPGEKIRIVGQGVGYLE